MKTKMKGIISLKIKSKVLKRLNKGKLLQNTAVAIHKGKRYRDTGENHKIQNSGFQTIAWRPCENIDC